MADCLKCEKEALPFCDYCLTHMIAHLVSELGITAAEALAQLKDEGYVEDEDE